jgi:uncharacterized membrane protein
MGIFSMSCLPQAVQTDPGVAPNAGSGRIASHCASVSLTLARMHSNFKIGLREEEIFVNGKSSLNMSENVAALIAYLFGWLSGLIILLLEKESRFVRFHALQSLIFFGAMSLILGMLGRIPVIGLVVVLVGGIATFGFWIIGMVKAYQGELYRFPIVGDIAAGQIKE